MRHSLVDIPREAARVLIDQTTLSDLEVFQGPDRSGCVFSLIDRTRTASGSAALRRRIQEPLAGLAEIRLTQEAVRFLCQHPGVVHLHERSVAAVAAYLHSNITVCEKPPLLARAEHAWMVLRFGEVLRELRAGVAVTRHFFGDVARLCQRLRDLDSPEAILDLVVELEAAAEQVALAASASGGLLGVDRAIRRQGRAEIAKALAALAELDALQSMAEATRDYGWVFPDFIDQERFDLEVEGVLHPFLSDGVANPARLSGGEPMVFLTGPNMAGKTTYLKSVAIVVLLAQTGMGVPARRVRLTPVEALLTSLNPTDDLRAGLSYFLAEVMRVKAAATILAEDRRALIMFDEVFKGTNVRDALDASTEVILGFARARNSGFIFSSHLAELADVLAENAAIRFCCFDGDIVDGKPQYAYQLREGVSEKRFGLLLLNQARVPELLARISA